MNSLKNQIDNEFKNVSFELGASQIVSVYKRQRRKNAAVLLSAFVCVAVLTTFTLRSNPEGVESFMQRTGQFFSSIFAGEGETLTAKESSRPENTTAAAAVKPKNSEPSESSDGTALVTTEAKETEKAENIVNTPESQASTEKATEAKEERNETSPNTTAPTKPATEMTTKPASEGIKLKVTSDGTVELLYLPKDAKVINIPEKIGDRTVTAIAPSFIGLGGYVTDVYLPDTVTFIGDRAFDGMKKLKTVRMSKNIRSIGFAAFRNCINLREIELYDIQKIGNEAFYGCESLTELNVPESASTVGSYAFAGCIGLKSAVINSNCDDNDSFNTANTFRGCTALETVSFGDNVTVIQENAFYLCASLKNISFSDNLTEIRKNAFYKCRSLTTLNLPDSLLKIGASAFYGCNNLKSVTIPETVTSIGSMSLGYYDRNMQTVKNGKVIDSWTEDAALPGFTIRGTTSVAKNYATSNGFVYKDINPSNNSTEITLDKRVVVLAVDKIYKINYKIEGKDIATTFSSDKPSVAVVDEKGTVTAKSGGNATITVTNNGVSVTLLIIVE